MTTRSPQLSVVIPVFNEAAGLQHFHDELTAVLTALDLTTEVIYCNDGSYDNSADIIRDWAQKDQNIKLLSLSKNFGKEAALAAGISVAKGEAILMIDADGQHPVELIPEFIKGWEQGAQVVIGIRQSNEDEGFVKEYGSKLFYFIFNKFAPQPLIPGSTDFRLITRDVQTAFLRLKESDRLTRGLIDWLGFHRAFVSFDAKPRAHGQAAYSNRKLFGLAANSIVSLTVAPLYFFGYIGVFITFFSLLLGSIIFLEQLLLGDPFSWNFTGTALLGILTIFLVGMLLLSQGILALYISHIHSESKQRPLFVIDFAHSSGIQTTTKNDHTS